MPKNVSFEFNPPSSRNWRDIPQPVKPRAMSREGRRRLTLAVMRGSVVALVAGGVIWSCWEINRAVNERSGPALVKGESVTSINLITDGTLDQAWVRRTLALPKNATLLKLNLEQLRQRILAHGQVIHATVVRDLPSTLVVRVTERSPVARVMAEVGGEQQMLFVARDGAVFSGVGFDEGMIETLPWLAGVKIVRTEKGFLPIAGMPTVTELLAKAKLQAEHLYLTWRVVSLDRLESDGVVEVRTKQDGLRVRFSTRQDFFSQLARLDYIIDETQRRTGLSAKSIDLTQDPQDRRVDVHVQVSSVPSTEEVTANSRPAQIAPAAAPKAFALPAFPNISSRP